MSKIVTRFGWFRFRQAFAPRNSMSQCWWSSFIATSFPPSERP